MGHSVAWSINDSSSSTTLIGKYGLKQGANVKNKKGVKSFRADICDFELCNLYLKLKPESSSKTYEELKADSHAYREACDQLKSLLPGGWTDKDVKASCR